MGSNDLHNTGLVLGLGLSVESYSAYKKQANDDQKHPDGNNHHIMGRKLFLSDHHHHHQTQPSLTLSLSGDHHQQQTRTVVNKDVGDNHSDLRNKSGAVLTNDQISGDLSAASSLSNVSSVKREREVVVGTDDLEIEKVSSIRVVNDEDDDGSNGRKKLRLTKAQSALLEESFKHHSTLNPKQKQELARDLKLRPRQVEVWFQNRRARTKLKQTEVDLEFLKKCCETLTEENRRLQKEVKALKLAQPLYMQLPAATLTMCPSCERIGGGSGEAAGGEAAKGPFAATLKPRLFNPPFASPSSAC